MTAEQQTAAGLSHATPGPPRLGCWARELAAESSVTCWTDAAALCRISAHSAFFGPWLELGVTIGRCSATATRGAGCEAVGGIAGYRGAVGGA